MADEHCKIVGGPFDGFLDCFNVRGKSIQVEAKAELIVETTIKQKEAPAMQGTPASKGMVAPRKSPFSLLFGSSGDKIPLTQGLTTFEALGDVSHYVAWMMYIVDKVPPKVIASGFGWELLVKGGARKKRASLYLKEFVKDQGIFFIGLLETKMVSIGRMEVNELIGVDWDFFCVPSNGLSGGILILWKSKFSNFKALESSSQFVIGDLEVANKGCWRIATIYGSKEVLSRRLIWSSLEKFSSKEIPMIIGGDFNCLLSKEDKRGGKTFTFSLGSKEMKNFLACNDFHKPAFVGPRFTWCNNKLGEERILERLDRCFFNSIVLNYPYHIVVRHLARIASDHCPIILNLLVFNSNSNKNIKFENVWSSYPASLGIVKGAWEKNAFGSPSQILNIKSKRSLKALFFWSKSKFKSFSESKEVLMKEILVLQEKESREGWLSEEDSWILKSKLNELNSILAKLSTWWKQRAKVKWCVEGDRNSKFFQSFANAWSKSNYIHKIKDGNGCMVEDPFLIEDCFFRFFKDKWKGKNCKLDGWPNHRISLDPSYLNFLNREFSIEEVEVAVKQGGCDTSPGLDKASKKMVKEFKGIISDFCGWTGLNINYSKSCMVFGKLVKRRNRKSISQIMGFKSVKEFSYLGIKIALRRLGKSDFQFIIDKVLDKVNTWGTKLISLAGRLTLRNYAEVSFGIGLMNGKDCIMLSGKFFADLLEVEGVVCPLVQQTSELLELNKCIDLWPTFVVVPEVEEISVDLFISNGDWDVQGLHRFFGIDLVNLICKITIREDLVEDEMELVQFKPGRTVSALVKEKVHCNLDEGSNFYWIGKNNLNPRVEIFWWRLLNNGIPTNQFLSYRRLQDNRECNRCVGSIEDIAHIVIACKNMLAAVEILNGWGFGIPHFKMLDKCFRWLKAQNKLLLNIFCNLVFFTWKARNIHRHGGKADSPQFIASNSVSLATISNSFYCYSSGNWDANQKNLFNCWHPPPPDWIKVNVDAALLPNNKAGIAVVFRDHKGRFILAAGRDFMHWDASKLELLAVQFIKEFINERLLDCKGIIIEGDNQNRDGNKLADFCASLAILGAFIWEDISDLKVHPSFVKLLKEESGVSFN
ncbi:hypothetical protein M5K25_003802 [Dendrobium thyrsiflorum]|uniref:Reverse transcriptase zinc-binding domain-containing protein n=1 Tax=Dendrobium thyrsiflorum TaxID=117978 RepID=A0ABD0VK65_DENTH